VTVDGLIISFPQFYDKYFVRMPVENVKNRTFKLYDLTNYYYFSKIILTFSLYNVIKSIK